MKEQDKDDLLDYEDSLGKEKNGDGEIRSTF
jgi:hypothetical protein